MPTTCALNFDHVSLAQRSHLRYERWREVESALLVACGFEPRAAPDVAPEGVFSAQPLVLEPGGGAASEVLRRKRSVRNFSQFERDQMKAATQSGPAPRDACQIA